MRHLDERISDLIDGRLDHDERDRALAHLTVCATCREAVEFERHAKNALRALPYATPSSRLVDSLLALAEPGEPMPPRSWQASAPAPVAPWRSHDSHHRRGRAMRVLALGAGSTAAALVLLASLGGAPASDSAPTPASILPPFEQFTVEHARSTGGLPFVQPASLLLTDGSLLGDGR